MSRRSCCWLAARQQAVVSAGDATGAELHKYNRPGVWVLHLTVAPRVHLTDLPTWRPERTTYSPLTATATRAAPW